MTTRTGGERKAETTSVLRAGTRVAPVSGITPATSVLLSGAER